MWILISALFNILASAALKSLSADFTDMSAVTANPTAVLKLGLCLVAYLAAFVAYFLALRSHPMAIAYVSITALSTAGIAIVGWIVWRELLSLSQLVCIALIFAGVSGLQLTMSSR